MFLQKVFGTEQGLSPIHEGNGNWSGVGVNLVHLKSFYMSCLKFTVDTICNFRRPCLFGVIVVIFGVHACLKLHKEH